jgi:putative SOS response-associated peptidase YedK
MCGRYASTAEVDDLVAMFDAEDATDDVVLPADWNVAPTKDVHVVAVRHGARQVRVMRWGLVPSWAENPSGGARMINARAETLLAKPAFRAAAIRRRCLVPADGWYEWARDAGRRQPYFMTAAGGGTLAFAGLYEVWRQDETTLLTCTIVTTAAIGPLVDVHDRMPLLLAPDRWAAWLGEGDAAVDNVEPLLVPPSLDEVAALELRPVGNAVGNVANNGPELVLPQVGTESVAQTLF